MCVYTANRPKWCRYIIIKPKKANMQYTHINKYSPQFLQKIRGFTITLYIYVDVNIYTYICVYTYIYTSVHIYNIFSYCISDTRFRFTNKCVNMCWIYNTYLCTYIYTSVHIYEIISYNISDTRFRFTNKCTRTRAHTHVQCKRLLSLCVLSPLSVLPLLLLQ